MPQIAIIFNRIAPIIILLGLGKWIQNRKIFPESTISDLKKLVVNFTMPAVLFGSFYNMDLQLTYVWFIPILISINFLLFLIGSFIQKWQNIKGEYFPFLIPGFEYGMIGVSLFVAAYGIEHLGKIAVIDFGQELFIWFVYMALLTQKREGSTNLISLLKMFITSPVIIAILSGILLNIFGIPGISNTIPLLDGLLGAVDLLGSLTVPLILIVVGYGIQLDKQEFAYSTRVILIRLLVNIPISLLLNHYVIDGFLGLEAGFQAALFTLLILPPPFILTLFMKQDLIEERHSIDNTLTLHTIVTILVFIVYYALNPTI